MRGASDVATRDTSATQAGVLSMPSLQQAVWRRIEFSRYRKPHLVQYPRNATVLNPQHAASMASQRNATTQPLRSPEATATLHFGRASGSANHRRTAPKGADDDDPRYQPDDELLCRDNVFVQQVLTLQWADRGSPILVGLENLGNTCYLNSVLQAIAHVPPLSQFLTRNFSSAHQATGAPIDFAFLVADTLRRMLTGSNTVTRGNGGSTGRSRVMRPSAIVGHLRGISKHLRLGQQCDAHEFYVNLIQAIQASLLFRTHGPKKFALRIAMSTPLMRLVSGYLCSQVAWSVQEEVQSLKRERLAQAAVDLEMTHRGSNGGCGRANGQHDDGRLVSNTYDPFTVLSLEIVGHSLHDCLRHFCRVETLDGKIYKTPRGVHVRATKSFRIHIPPPVLVIQLKRFDLSRSKVNKRIAIPLRLDVQPYCTEGLASYGGLDAVTTYELCAVCVHEGTSLNYGHYVAFVKLKSGAWAHCNDEHVTVVSVDTVLQSQAYMLFYAKCFTDVAAALRGDRAHDPLGSSHAGDPPALALSKSSARASSSDHRSPSTSARMTEAPLPPLVAEEGLAQVGRELTGEEAQRVLEKILMKRKRLRDPSEEVEQRVDHRQLSSEELKRPQNDGGDRRSRNATGNNSTTGREVCGDEARIREVEHHSSDYERAGHEHPNHGGAYHISNTKKGNRADALLSQGRAGSDDDDDVDNDSSRLLQRRYRLNRAIALEAKASSPKHAAVSHLSGEKSSLSANGSLAQRHRHGDPRSRLVADDDDDHTPLPAVTTAAATTETGCGSLSNNGDGSHVVVAVGAGALDGWDAAKHAEQLATIDRKRWDARLRLRVRDEQYEREMDKGRVAKKGRRERGVAERERSSGEARANPFQMPVKSFDRRGRQLRQQQSQNHVD